MLHSHRYMYMHVHYKEIYKMYAYQGFIQDFLVGGEEVCGTLTQCMHEYETTVLSMRLYKFSSFLGGN